MAAHGQGAGRLRSIVLGVTVVAFVVTEFMIVSRPPRRHAPPPDLRLVLRFAPPPAGAATVAVSPDPRQTGDPQVTVTVTIAVGQPVQFTTSGPQPGRVIAYSRNLGVLGYYAQETDSQYLVGLHPGHAAVQVLVTLGDGGTLSRDAEVTVRAGGPFPAQADPPPLTLTFTAGSDALARFAARAGHTSLQRGQELDVVERYPVDEQPPYQIGVVDADACGLQVVNPGGTVLAGGELVTRIVAAAGGPAAGCPLAAAPIGRAPLNWTDGAWRVSSDVALNDLPAD
jgi:hypothetical protein